MKKISGLVLEVGRHHCTILAPGNQYVKLRLGQVAPQIGEIYEGYPYNLSQRPVSRIWAYAASILITLVLGTYQVYAITLAPAAYVSLDSSSSVELVLNSHGKVIKTNVYNPQGAQLLKQAPVTNLPVTDALKALLSVVATQSTTTTSATASTTSPTVPTTKVLVLTYTDSSAVSGSNLTNTVANLLQQDNYQGQLLSDQVNETYRDQANSVQLSPGQQLILDLAKSGDTPLSATQLRQSGLDQLLTQYNVDLNNLLKPGIAGDYAPPVLVQIQPPTHTSMANPNPQGREQRSTKTIMTKQVLPTHPVAVQPNSSNLATKYKVSDTPIVGTNITEDISLAQASSPASLAPVPTASPESLQPGNSPQVAPVLPQGKEYKHTKKDQPDKSISQDEAKPNRENASSQCDSPPNDQKLTHTAKVFKRWFTPS